MDDNEIYPQSERVRGEEEEGRDKRKRWQKRVANREGGGKLVERSKGMTCW